MNHSVKAILNEAVDENLFPGAQFAIINKNGIQRDALGYKRFLPEKEGIRGDEIYDVASLTKVIVTTTLIMKLIEDQVIKYDDQISETLPSFKHKDITYHDLLTHTSGLPADIIRAATLKNRQQVIDYVFHIDKIYDTGKNIVYSDIGFILMGLAIEKIYGKPLDQCAEAIIFKPLGMKDTSFRPLKSRCAPTEYRNDEVYQGFLEGKVHDEKSFAMGGISGHAGLFSTADDIALFIMAILEDRFVLSKKTTDELFVARTFLKSMQGIPLIRAYGWDKPQLGGSAGNEADFEETILHTGFTGCNMWINRKKYLGFVLLTNDVHPTREQKGVLSLRNKIANTIYQMEV